ncbi:hypothetical protein [Streptomyces sp. SID5910]|uniref:hypothetical protein n=1 Tax=Streptomyces sp. SID5910 TaxID=2690312 RepID=UPI00136B9C1F|nr:hypothetical protein [Streptomyces sp. SID5910]MYR46590.1 hypothetical protein [Streptomyces sp. SID5910]
MTVRAAWLLPGGSGPGQTREDTRLTPVGTMTPDGELTTRPGVVPGGNPFAATSAGAMSLRIGIGRGAVQGTAAQGAYPVAVTSPETVTFTDGAAQFTRIDTVAVHVYDGLYDVSGQTLAAIEVVEGQASATPAPPVLPAGYLRLWDVTVPAGASAGTGGINWSTALTDRRQYTTAVGGIVPQGAAGTYAGAYDGQYRDTGTGLERWNAADDVWEAYPPPAAGWQSYTPTLSNTTLGNGSLRARYLRDANRVAVAWNLAWGSSTSGNLPVISLPVPPASLGGMRWTGTCTISRGSGTWRAGWAFLADNGGAVSTYAVTSSAEITSTLSAAGITMGTGGWVAGDITYEVAE